MKTQMTCLNVVFIMITIYFSVSQALNSYLSLEVTAALKLLHQKKILAINDPLFVIFLFQEYRLDHSLFFKLPVFSAF